MKSMEKPLPPLPGRGVPHLLRCGPTPATDGAMDELGYIVLEEEDDADCVRS